MSKGFNKVILQGNLTKDPEVMSSQQSGTKFARFTMAIGESWKDKNSGEKKEHTEFVNCSAFGALADVAERYLAKGKPVLVEGKIKTTTQEKDGQKRYFTGVSVSGITLLGRKSDGNGGSTTGQDDFDFADFDQNGPDVGIPF